MEEKCKVSYLLMCLVCVTLKCIESTHNVVKTGRTKIPDATLEKSWPHFSTLDNVILSFELSVN